MINANKLVYEFLTEASAISEKEFIDLSESSKMDTMKEIAMQVLQTIQTKAAGIETVLIDKSRGDIKQIKDLDSLQKVISSVEAVLERTNKTVPVEAKEYVNTVIKSILYLNKFAPEFKDAYRNKKTLLILKYESLILSVFSAATYLASAIVDFRAVSLDARNKVEVEEIAPIRTLKEFILSVDNGNFKSMIKDVTFLRENFNEISVEDMGRLLEASDFFGMINNGIESFKNAFNGPKSNNITTFLYKAAGVILLILSMREIFYMLGRMRTKFSEILEFIRGFGNFGLSGAASKLAGFGSRFTVDAEESSKIASYDISDENHEISKVAKKPILSFDATASINSTPDDGDGSVGDGLFNF